MERKRIKMASGNREAYRKEICRDDEDHLKRSHGVKKGV